MHKYILVDRRILDKIIKKIYNDNILCNIINNCSLDELYEIDFNLDNKIKLSDKFNNISQKLIKYHQISNYYGINFIIIMKEIYIHNLIGGATTTTSNNMSVQYLIKLFSLDHFKIKLTQEKKNQIDNNLKIGAKIRKIKEQKLNQKNKKKPNKQTNQKKFTTEINLKTGKKKIYYHDNTVKILKDNNIIINKNSVINNGNPILKLFIL